jgi:hypothetical protein
MSSRVVAGSSRRRRAGQRPRLHDGELRQRGERAAVLGARRVGAALRAVTATDWGLTSVPGPDPDPAPRRAQTKSARRVGMLLTDRRDRRAFAPHDRTSHLSGQHQGAQRRSTLDSKSGGQGVRGSNPLSSTLAPGAPPPEFVQVRRGFLHLMLILGQPFVWLLRGPSGANLEHGVGGREVGSRSAPGPQRSTRLFGACLGRLEIGCRTVSLSRSGGRAGRQGVITAATRAWWPSRTKLRR